MRERQNAMERSEVEADLQQQASWMADGEAGSSGGSGGQSSGPPQQQRAGVRPEEVLDQLTERIAVRLRTELKAELQVREGSR